MLAGTVELHPVHFYRPADGFPQQQFGPDQAHGLIAQEVEQALPELVTEDAQGYLQVDYSKLPLLTLPAVKELNAENDALKQQNGALEARLVVLESTMQQLRDRR